MKSVFSNIPQKILVALAAVVIWYLVSLNNVSTSQKSFTVPVVLEGISENQIVSGAPKEVDIVVSGLSKQIDRLKPESFTAYLDFNQSSGSYDKRIRVDFPQGTRLISTSPATAIGTVEQISQKEYDIEILFETPLSQNSLFSARAEPKSVTIKGRESVLDKIAKVIAIVNPTNVNLNKIITKVVALDPDNQAISELEINPSEVTIFLEKSPILHPKIVDVILEKPEIKDFIVDSVELSKNTITIVGPKAKLDKIEKITAKVDLDTQKLEAGTYNVKTVLELADGIAAMDLPTVKIVLSKIPELVPEIVPEAEGETNDTTNTPIRRPDTPENKQPNSGF